MGQSQSFEQGGPRLTEEVIRARAEAKKRERARKAAERKNRKEEIAARRKVEKTQKRTEKKNDGDIEIVARPSKKNTGKKNTSTSKKTRNTSKVKETGSESDEDIETIVRPSRIFNGKKETSTPKKRARVSAEEKAEKQEMKRAESLERRKKRKIETIARNKEKKAKKKAETLERRGRKKQERLETKERHSREKAAWAVAKANCKRDGNWWDKKDNLCKYPSENEKATMEKKKRCKRDKGKWDSIMGQCDFSGRSYDFDKLHKDAAQWEAYPGTAEVNDDADKRMQDAGLKKGDDRFYINCDKGAMAYQQTVPFLVHPATNINRLLVVHRTGAGKTLTMIKVLDNFYEDRRAKVVIFPTHEVAVNFYTELLRYPNKYRDYALKYAPEGGRLTPDEWNTIRYTLQIGTTYTRPGGSDASIAKEYKDALDKLENILALKGKLTSGAKRAGGALRAPIRPMSYPVAGGTTVLGQNFDGKEEPSGRNALFVKYKERTLKTGATTIESFWDTETPYNDMIVVCDEFHNLLKPYKKMYEQYEDNLDGLRENLMRMKRSVLVGMTATPIRDDIKDAEDIMTLIRGNEYKDVPKKHGMKGFVSYFNDLHPNIYPKVINMSDEFPAKITRIPLHDQESIKWKSGKYMGGKQKYFSHHKESLRKKDNKKRKEPPLEDLLRLQLFCNTYSVDHWMRERPWMFDRSEQPRPKNDDIAPTRKSPRGTRSTYNSLPDDFLEISPIKAFMPKFAYVCNKLSRYKEGKILVLIAQRNGLKTFVEALQAYNVDKFEVLAELNDIEKNALLARFNSAGNREGNDIRILVVDTEHYSEGVSFFQVTKLFVMNPASNWAQHKQQIGRILRACSHHVPELKGKRKVEIELMISTYAKDDEDDEDERGEAIDDLRPLVDIYTADEILFEQLKVNMCELESALNEFKVNAIDYQRLDDLFPKKKINKYCGDDVYSDFL